MKFDVFKSYALITVGLFIFALGWTGFIIPSNIVSSGVAGIGSLIYFAADIPVGYSVFAINSVLLLLGLKVLGGKFGLKTFYGIVVSAILFTILQRLIQEPFVEDRFMAAIVGGIMSGGSLGLIFSQGGTTGGTDIIAMIVNKKRNISPGKIIFYCDILIISSSFILFQSIETIVFGLVTMGVQSYVIDIYLTGMKQSLQIFIISKDKSHEIADFIGSDMKKGVTFINGKGWYSKEDMQIVMVVVRKNNMQNVLRSIKQIDPDAFITAATVMGVYGKGFDNIR